MSLPQRATLPLVIGSKVLVSFAHGTGLPVSVRGRSPLASLPRRRGPLLLVRWPSPPLSSEPLCDHGLCLPTLQLPAWRADRRGLPHALSIRERYQYSAMYHDRGDTSCRVEIRFPDAPR